jgi:hypothetical protein
MVPLLIDQIVKPIEYIFKYVSLISIVTQLWLLLSLVQLASDWLVIDFQAIPIDLIFRRSFGGQWTVASLFSFWTITTRCLPPLGKATCSLCVLPP